MLAPRRPARAGRNCAGAFVLQTRQWDRRGEWFAGARSVCVWLYFPKSSTPALQAYSTTASPTRQPADSTHTHTHTARARKPHSTPIPLPRLEHKRSRAIPACAGWALCHKYWATSCSVFDVTNSLLRAQNIQNYQKVVYFHDQLVQQLRMT